jgi:hypothetical protein
MLGIYNRPLCLQNVWIYHVGLHNVAFVIGEHMSPILCATFNGQKSKYPLDGKSVPLWQPCFI